ncbi:MAG: hypothetical protein M3O09_12800 [Acidobacteriota bacterium]|nr:hypothetical protein [Acidobacteriota bacterium]
MITPRNLHPPARSAFSFLRCGSFSARRAIVAAILSLFYLPACWGANSSSSEHNREKPYALIFGTVWGPDNRPLYRVKVKLRRSEDKKWRWEQYSDHNGEFAVRVPSGKAEYIVWADVRHYKLVNGEGLHPSDEIKVQVENEERVDTGLHLK